MSEGSLAPPSPPSPQGADNPAATGDSKVVNRIKKSVLTRIKIARLESSNPFIFFKKILIILLSTVAYTIVIAIGMAIPVTMIIIGVLFKDECPAETKIPIYLIVAGSTETTKTIFKIISRCSKSQEKREKDQTKPHPLNTLIGLFNFIWFICGNVWVYGTTDYNTDDPKTNNYCNATLYWFSFWLITSTYILFGLIILGGILSCTLYCFCCVPDKLRSRNKGSISSDHWHSDHKHDTRRTSVKPSRVPSLGGLTAPERVTAGAVSLLPHSASRMSQIQFKVTSKANQHR